MIQGKTDYERIERKTWKNRAEAMYDANLRLSALLQKAKEEMDMINCLSDQFATDIERGCGENATVGAPIFKRIRDISAWWSNLRLENRAVDDAEKRQAGAEKSAN